MFIKQISVFVENKFGRIAKIVDLLSKNNINITSKVQTFFINSPP